MALGECISEVGAELPERPSVCEQLVLDDLYQQLEHQRGELIVVHKPGLGHVYFSQQAVDLALGQAQVELAHAVHELAAIQLA